MINFGKMEGGKAGKLEKRNAGMMEMQKEEFGNMFTQYSKFP
jgi:hypothetical protein